MKKEMLSLFFLLTSFLLYSQHQGTLKAYTETELQALGVVNPSSTGLRSIDNRYEGVQGTPFFSEDWQKGTFKLVGKEDFGEVVQIKFDLAAYSLFFKLSNDKVGMLPSTRVKAFRIYTDEESFRLFRLHPAAAIEGSNDQQFKFYEVLLDGPFVLLKRHAKELQKADYKGAYSTDKRYDEYVDLNSLWLAEAGKGFHKVKVKRKSIEQALPGHANKIQKIIKSEKLSLKQEEDLVHLLKVLQK